MASRLALVYWAILLICLVRLSFSNDVLSCCNSGLVLDVEQQKCVPSAAEFVTETYAEETEAKNPLIQCSHGWANFTTNIRPSGVIVEPIFNQILATDEYCVHSITQDEIENKTTIIYCQPTPLIVKKCCPLGYVLNRTSIDQCVPSDWLFNASLYLQQSDLPMLVQANVSLTCEFDYNVFLPEIYVDHKFSILSTGELYLEKSVYELFRRTFDYCIDSAVGSAGGHEPIAVTCLPQRMHLVGLTLRWIHPFTQLFSACLLLITLLVYIVLPSLHNRLQGKVMICFFLSIFVVQMEYVVLLFLPREPHTWCSLKKHFAIYFRCASSTWITVLGFIIWRQLKFLRPSKKTNEWFEFACLSLYAWGLPLIWYFVVKSKMDSPETGQVCWIYNPTVRMWLQTPNFVLVTLNLIFFIPSVLKVYGSLKFLKTAVTPLDLCKLEKQRFAAICRFFLLMQFCAIHYSIPSIVNEIFGFNAAGPELVFYIVCFTQFIGPAIFYFFVWKPEVLAMISKAIGGEPSKKIRLSIMRRKISPRIAFLNGRYQSYSTSESELPVATVRTGCYKTLEDDRAST